jgi:solute carrier family 25 phosphate transporter 3
MPSLFPTSSALSAVFGKRTPAESSEKKEPSQTQFQTWSVTEDAERKASELNTVAAKKYQKASSIAQAKAGNIELYSAKYCEFASWRLFVVLVNQRLSEC